MEAKDVKNLMEAYASLYTPQEELTEEVQIAAQYFYEMGLNEDGVNILIEELGVEEFAEFVYDIAEEYVLTEARTGGVKIEPVTAKGQKFKSGKPTGKSLQRLRDKKAERKAGEEEASAAKPSGMKAALQRQSAVAAAAKKQPKKPGLLDRMAGAVTRGIERHNAAMGELKKMGAATSVTAGKVKKAAGEFKRGFTSEEFETWVNALVEEGYDLSEYTWDDMYEIYLNEAKKSDSPRQTFLPKSRERDIGRHDDWNDKTSEKWGERPPAGQKLKRRAQAVVGTQRRQDKEVGIKEGTDLFDYILEHLVAEGYADTNENALVIMANMSEEWKQSILDEEAPKRIAIEPSSPRLMPNAGPARVHDPKKIKKVVRK